MQGRASEDGTELEWKLEHDSLDKKAQSPRPPWSASLAIGPFSPYRIFGVLAIRFPAGLANTPSRPNECDVRVAYMGLEEEDHSPNVTRPVSIKQAEVVIVRGQDSVKVLELVDAELNTVALCLYIHSQSPSQRSVSISPETGSREPNQPSHPHPSQRIVSTGPGTDSKGAYEPRILLNILCLRC